MLSFSVVVSLVSVNVIVFLHLTIFPLPQQLRGVQHPTSLLPSAPCRSQDFPWALLCALVQGARPLA